MHCKYSPRCSRRIGFRVAKYHNLHTRFKVDRYSQRKCLNISANTLTSSVSIRNSCAFVVAHFKHEIRPEAREAFFNSLLFILLYPSRHILRTCDRSNPLVLGHVLLAHTQLSDSWHPLERSPSLWCRPAILAPSSPAPWG